MVIIPDAGATTGVPVGLAISIPKCGRLGSPFKTRWLPYTPEIGPVAGQIKISRKSKRSSCSLRAFRARALSALIRLIVSGFLGVTFEGGKPSMRWIL